MGKPVRNSPPRFALRFLEWFSPPSLFEGIEGDLVERFEQDLKVPEVSDTPDTYRLRRAQRRLTWNVIRFFRPAILLRNKFSLQLINIVMLRSYFKMTYRNILKNKGYSFINIFGLSLGIACCLLMFNYAKFELSYDNFQPNVNRTYRVDQTLPWSSEGGAIGSTAPPLANVMKVSYPEVEDAMRVNTPGDFIIRQDDPATNFYVIEKGEVEVVRSTDKDPKGEVIAVLNAGSFFGERGLLSNDPRVASVRARTAVEVLVIGKNVFTQISGALGPLRDALAQALNRRGIDVWKGEPQVHDLLSCIQLKDLMEPVPQPLLRPDASLRDVGHAFVENGNEFFYVSSDGQTLEGVLTITDLLRGRANGATDKTPAAELMSKNPVALAADDTCAVAAAAFREYRLKSLPVVEHKDSRKLAGCIKVRRLMAYVFKQIGDRSEGRGVGKSDQGSVISNQ